MVALALACIVVLQIPPGAHKEPAGFVAGTPEGSFAAAWRALGRTHNACDDRDLGYDYWPDGGIRNFYCHALSVMSWRALLKLAPMKPWLRGPHGRWKEGKLALHDRHDFGRYNPAFVRWLVDNAVPAAGDAELREETQPLYDADVKKLARVYFVVYRHIEARPAWKKRERALYLKTMDEKNPDWGSFYDKYSELLGDAGHDWGGYDPNLQSAAAAFWLRRDVDGTAPLFFEGLDKLLRTYDAAWRSAHER